MSVQVPFKSKRSSSVEAKLRRIFFLALQSCLIVAFIGFATTFAFYSLVSFSQELVSAAKVAGANTRATLVFNDQESGARVLAGFKAKEDILYAVLRNQEGALVAEHLSPPAQYQPLPRAESESSRWSLTQAQVSSPIYLDEEYVGSIELIASLRGLYSRTLRLLFTVFVVFGLSSLVGVYFGAKLRELIIKPVLSLRDLAHQVAVTKGFSGSFHLADADELHQLTLSFNQMLTQLEARERELTLAKNKAEDADRLKSIFLATVSHEVRTPLHTILGVADESLQLSTSNEQRQLLEILKNSGNLLISLINDILDFSKIEAGKLELIPSAVNLEQLIRQILQIFQLRADKKNIDLSCTIDNDVPRDFIADGSRLAQVLINIIGNALKFTNSGSVKLKISLCREQPLAGKSSLRFLVTDTGIGIPKEDLNQIFDSFTQVRRDKELTEGTGLGLAIASRLINLMGGRIWAESSLGSGSSFYFEVDLEHAQKPLQAIPSGRALDLRTFEMNPNQVDQAATASTQPTETGHAAVILVVEDNLVNSRLAVRMLERAGFQTLSAENGEECLRVMEREVVDLVLMDLNMPIMDGITATEKIREQERANAREQVPIVALTANAMDDQAIKCFESGMNDYLKKPIDRKTLVETILRHLNRNAPTYALALSIINNNRQLFH